MSDRQEAIDPIRKMFEERGIAAARNRAVRAIGFLEGLGALLRTQAGPNLADEAVAEFERRVSDIAAYIGLPPREGDAE